MPDKEIIVTDKAPKAIGPYTVANRVGNLVFTAGQLGLVPATMELAPGGIEAETRQALENLGTVLRAAGVGYQDVVSVTAYLADFRDFPKFNQVYREVFSKDPPARATVQVAGLNLGARVEIQMIAARPARVPSEAATSAARAIGAERGSSSLVTSR